MNPNERAGFDLGVKKSLIIHNYDLFLERQTRLFFHASPRSICHSNEIEEKAEMLLLDDLTIFATSCRRLIDLCCLQSASNKLFIYHQGIDHSYEPARTYRLEKRTGFYSILNQIIHMTLFLHFNSRRKMHFFFFGSENREALFRQITSLRDQDEAIGVVLIKDDRKASIMFRLENS